MYSREYWIDKHTRQTKAYQVLLQTWERTRVEIERRKSEGTYCEHTRAWYAEYRLGLRKRIDYLQISIGECETQLETAHRRSW